MYTAGEQVGISPQQTASSSRLGVSPPRAYTCEKQQGHESRDWINQASDYKQQNCLCYPVS